jgi:hypothetical protein
MGVSSALHGQLLHHRHWVRTMVFDCGRMLLALIHPFTSDLKRVNY